MTTTEPLPTQAFLDGAQDVNQPARYECIADIIKGCSSVLDVGCGDGLLRKYWRRGHYLGIDRDSLAIEKAKSSYFDTVFEFICADAENWNTTAKFDAVVLNEVLYYLSDPLKALRKWIKCVNPGGLLVVSIKHDHRGNVRWWLKHPNLHSINPNMNALNVARVLAPEEHPIAQNGKKWSVLVIHP